LSWDLQSAFRDASSRRLMGMHRRRDMDTAMRLRITQRRQLAWGSGLVVGDAVGGGDRFGRLAASEPTVASEDDRGVSRYVRGFVLGLS
jgi:hypothetical protein